MTRSLRLALLFSLVIHLAAAYLSFWLAVWKPGIPVQESTGANPLPPKPFSVSLRPPPLPSNKQVEESTYAQTRESVQTTRERVAVTPRRANDHIAELVAPRFMSPPDFSFVEFYPRKLKTQLTIRVYVSSAGLPERVEPVGTYVVPADLLDQLTKTLYRARFYPATQARNSVPAYLDIVISVEPETETQ